MEGSVGLGNTGFFKVDTILPRYVLLSKVLTIIELENELSCLADVREEAQTIDQVCLLCQGLS